MIDIVLLLEDAAAMIASCAEVRDELDGRSDAVSVYLDMTPANNSLTGAVYRQPNGNVLLAWLGSDIRDDEVIGWQHFIDIYVRSVRGRSPLKLIHAIIEGIPDGEDMRWRYLCVNPYMLPVEILEISRVVDEEGIDYYVIKTAFNEKSD